MILLLRKPDQAVPTCHDMKIKLLAGLKLAFALMALVAIVGVVYNYDSQQMPVSNSKLWLFMAFGALGGQLLIIYLQNRKR